MAIREVRIMGDDILEKQCKPVTKMTMRTKILIEDMLDTMYENMVWTGSTQVGVLKQIVVIDVGEGPIVLINPEIIETSGEQTGEEGCLSLPGKWGIVTRPNYVKVRALNEEMEEVELEGEAFFHVAKDASRPFIVKSGTAETRVLGTEFNFRAYPHESRHVTLVSGSVIVSDTQKENELRLTPGEDAPLDENDLMLIPRKVDINEYVAGKKIYSVF